MVEFFYLLTLNLLCGSVAAFATHNLLYREGK